MNEEIKEKLKTKIAISQIKNEEEKAMNKKENFIFKNIGIAACVLMSLTGVVFAGSKVIENIWKTPEKVQISSGDLEEITKIKGMGRVKAIQLKAICELANRMNKP